MDVHGLKWTQNKSLSNCPSSPFFILHPSSLCFMVFFVFDLAYTLHLTGPWHPERPERVVAIYNALTKAGLSTPSNTLKPRKATEKEILFAHTPSYYRLVQEEGKALAETNKITSISTGDAQLSALSFEVALLAAGGVLTGIDHVMQSTNSSAYCIVRPPGHHACSAVGMGFCLFNNIAVGARYAQQKYGINKVLVVDWDVHHGNGTQEIFYSDPTVYYFSTHEKGIYPNTGRKEEVGEGAGKGFTWNCPIEPGLQSRVEVLEAFSVTLKEKMETFHPDLVLISAGFDAHEDDPLGHFNLTDHDFFTLTQEVKEVADKYAKGRIVSVLEGGYNLNALASASVAHVKGLRGKS
jgi:acetoin utilization deacetylase AcuC-like enzyme